MHTLHCAVVESGVLRIVPLGGLGEIGMNCMALEQHDGICVIDCGTTFPNDARGIDVLHPDFRWLLERRERITGIFLTHGHEDHIGALPYLLDEVEAPVYGSPYALGLVRRRLREHDYDVEEVDLREAGPGELYEVGPFRIEPIRVSHSITEATCLRIETDAGVVVHSGDFSFDPAPLDGEPIDVQRLQAIGDAGVELLLSDSTNIDTPQRQGSEEEVARELDELIRSAPERVFVVLFASNVHRLIALGRTAERLGRKICLLGRSLRSHHEIATAVGRLCWPSHLLVSPEQAADMPGKDLLVISGGTQAEPRAAMTRLASGEHPLLRLCDTDRVIFSSRIIPGNERAVLAMHNDLLRAGVDLRTWRHQPLVHTSGHAGRSEQQRMLELLRPRCFVPVHGTLHHLREHAKLAREVGVAQTLIVENGRTIELQDASLQPGGWVPFGKVPVTERGIEISEETLKERSQLSRAGVLTIAVAPGPGARVPIELQQLGIAGLNEERDIQHLKRELQRTLGRSASSESLEGALRRTARGFLKRLDVDRCRIEVMVLGR